MEVKEDRENIGLKLNIQKTKIMASGPITSWQIDGETMETVRDYVLGYQITADGDCSHEIKRHLLLGRKVMTNLNSLLKSRDITLPTKVHLVKAMVFPVVVYGCESWTERELSAEELMLLNYGVGEDSLESLGLQGHPTISFFVIPLSSRLQSFPASGSFPVSQFFAPGSRSIGSSASASVFPMNTQDCSPLGWTDWISLQSKGLSRVFSNTTVQKHQFFTSQPSLWSNSHIHT